MVPRLESNPHFLTDLKANNPVGLKANNPVGPKANNPVGYEAFSARR